MNYRHGYHAGNFADVIKHAALVAILGHLRRKETAFAVIDTHAGRGLYDLSGEEARKTGEARGGIARLLAAPDLSPLLAEYRALVTQSGVDRYPGSPLLAARLLRPQDRLVAIERHPEEAALLKQVLAPWRKAVVEAADGYARLPRLLPPPERRGLILIDPPFEAPDEFARLAGALRAGLRRFATGIFLAWYPVKAPAEAEGFVGEVMAGCAAPAFTVELQVAAPEGRLGRTGILVLNPPFGLDSALETALGRLETVLDGARGRLTWRARQG